MLRVRRQHEAEVIAASLDLIPPRLRPWVACEFLCGVDPVFAGLHGYRTTVDGRSYRTEAHVVFPHHQRRLPASRRTTTVVLPGPKSLAVVVHEFGHVLHGALRWEPEAEPVSAYAATNRWEAFAEAFTSWLLPGYAGAPDPATVALLEGLAA